MIRSFKNILIAFFVLCLAASSASAVAITNMYRMDTTRSASFRSPFSTANTYGGTATNTTEVRQYLLMVVYDSAAGFTNLDAGYASSGTQNSLVDGIQYGLLINGTSLAVTAAEIYYWDSDAICFLVPEDILAGTSVQIQVIDNYVATTYTVDVVPPSTATFSAPPTVTSTTVSLGWSVTSALASGGYSSLTAKNCGVLLVRSNGAPLSTSSYPVDGSSFTAPSGSSVIYDDNASTSASETLPAAGQIYYYQTFIHDGKPNYNRTPATRELNLRFNIAGVFEPSGADAGAQITNAEPGTDIHITGEGFDNTGSSRKIEFFEDGTTTSLFSFDSGDIVTAAHSASNINWWADDEYYATEEGHIALTIPSTVTYRGLVDIVVTNGAGLATTYEGFSIVTDSGVLAPPTTTGTYTTGTSGFVATNEARVGNYIYVLGTNFGSDTTITLEGASRTVSVDYDLNASTEAGFTIPTIEAGGIDIVITNSYGTTSCALTVLAPEPVYSFTLVSEGDRQIMLSMLDNTWAATNEVVYSTTRAATSPRDSIVIGSLYGGTYSGGTHFITKTGLTNGTTYYFSAFASDGLNYSAAKIVIGTPESSAPTITGIYDSGGHATTEGKADGRYIQIVGTNLGAISTEVSAIKIGGVTLSASSYRWDYSTSISVWLPQGVKTGDITVEVRPATTTLSANWGHTFTIKPPDQVYNLSGTGGNRIVTLTWGNPDWDTAFYRTLVVRSSSPVTWTPTNEYTSYTAGSTPRTGIRVVYHGALETATDSSLTNGTRYYYRAFSRDLAGHYNTTEVTASATPDAGLPNITSITNSVGVTTNEGKVGNYIEINGTNFGATSTTLTGVRIGGVSISADSGSETSGYEWYSSAKIGVWLPQGVKTGYITVETTAGSRGSTSIFTIKPPDQIYYLNASAGNNQVSLTWANPSETAFSGVLIGRSTSRITWTPTNEVTAYSVGASLISGGKTINFVYNNSGSSTIDATVTNGTQYYYRVYAHDLAGHYNTTEVYDSATPDATAISTVPVITDAIRYLTVSTTTTEVYVGQRMNIQGTNLGAGTYEVYVGGQLAEYDAAADATNNAYFLSVIVPTLRLGSTTVEVVNSYSGERSNVDRVTVIPPQPPYYLNVNSGDSIVSVSWADNTQAGVVATVISRSSTATPESIGTAISGTPILTWTSLTIESQTYLDDDPAEIINGQVYYYNVFAYDGINYSAGYTLQSGETNVGQPAAGATGSSAPQVRAAYGWLSGGAATSSVHVGQLIGISGSNLGAGTYEVYINGVQTTYTTEAQSATFLKVYVPELSAGESSLTVRNAATGVSSDPYTGLTIAAPNPPYYLNVFSENNLVTVNWLDNYADGGVVATYLVKATESEGTPESITDGTVIYSTSEISSNMGAYSDTDVTNGSTYYYNVFSYDGTNYSSGYTLREGETNVGRPQAASAVFSAPHISGVYGWQADGSVTNEVKVGQIIGISGTNLGAGTYEVYVNDTLAAYAAEAQTRYYIKVYVPTIEAGAISIKVSIPATTFESNVYSGLTVVAPNPPYYLNVTSGDGVVNVYWLDNYADGGAVATLIVRSTDGTPESYADGTRIEPGARITDSLHTYVDNVSNGTIYYYNVFSYDGANYSAGYTLQSGETNVGTPAGVASDPAVSQVYYIVSLGAATIGSQTTEAAPGTCISISGARLGASGEVQFTGSGGIDHKLRLYSSDADNVSWWGDGSRVDVKVPSDAQSGYIKIIRGGDEESVQTDYITITNSSGESVHTPSISEISPASGAIGGTVVISGLYFGGEQGANQVAFADSLANTTYAPVTSWIDSRVVAVVPTGLSYQTYNVYLLVSGEATNAKDFTVTTASNMVIDDYEDSTTTNYFTFDSDSSCPLVEVQSSTVAEGSNAMKVAYTFADLSDDWGGGFGKTLGDNLDISSANYIVMYVKGDGSNNAFRLDLKEANSIDGETWSSALVALYNTNWHRVVLNLSAFTRNSSGAVGNGTFDRVIDEYHVVYTSEATSSAYHYIDYIIATTEAVEVGDSTPVIQSVNPREAVVGSTVGIVGSNFGSEEGESQVTLNGTSVGSVIYWSDTLILFNLPTTFTNGKYDLCVYRKNSALSIDELSEAYVFSVIATSTRAKAYPNPFNPLSDGTVKIEVTVTESITVSLYLYDMAARMVDQVTIPLLVGTNQIEWDGRDYTGAVVGDGVYLIRVVNDSTKELIAKGKILVIKRI